MIRGRRTVNRKLLAVTADDYGPHPCINKGVLDAIKHNRVSSVGVMTNKYWALNKTSYAYEFNLKTEVEALIEAINDPDRNKKQLRDIGIGIHLTISSGAPLTNDPALIPRKNKDQFQFINEFTFSSNKAHLDAMQKEIEAQIRALKVILDEKGLNVDHVSCHQGLLYLYEDYSKRLFAAVNAVYPADQYTIDEKPTIRTMIPISKMKGYKRKFKSRMKREGYIRAARMADDNKRKILKLIGGTGNKKLRARANTFRRANYLVPQYFFDNFYKKPSLMEIKEVCRSFPNGFPKNRGELVVHLGDQFDYHIDLQLHGINHQYLPQRKKELKFLKMAPLFDMAKRYGVEIVSMGGLR